MKRLRWFSVVACPLVALGLTAQSAGAGTTKITQSSLTGTALFSSKNGCIETDVQVTASRFTITGVLVPGGGLQLLLGVDIKRVNVCTRTTVQHLASESTAQIDVFNVRNSAMHVEGFDYLFGMTSASTSAAILPHGAVGTVNVNMTWTATGGPHTTTFHFKESPGGVGAQVVNGSQTVRAAIASGTVTQGSTTYASGTAVSAEMKGYRSHWIKP